MNFLNDNTSTSSSSKKNLTDEQQRRIYENLLQQSRDGALKRGSITYLAKLFSVDVKTIRLIWQRGKACIRNGLAVNVSSRKAGAVGRKRVEFDINKVSTIPLSRRTNIRSLSSALGISKSFLHRKIKEGLVKPHSNAIKPQLSEEHKRSRIQFSVSMIEPSTLPSQPRFKSMYDYIHIDEKWFYMTKESKRYYLLPEEEEPYRTCKSKRFITKVMFLAAVARPRYDAAGNELFSGKIGIFPFTCEEPAKRRSKNRAAGTMETKPMAVTKEINRSFLFEKILPAIRSKWPSLSATEPIYIQQDNAKPHICPTDADFLEAARKDGFDNRLLCQPPQSPDKNVLDLGYFWAIQSLQHQEAPKAIKELICVMEKSFEEMSLDNLNRVFLSWQTCMIEVMKVNEGNNYKLPHIGKSQMFREGSVVSSLECEPHVYQNALAHLPQPQPQRAN